MADLICISVFLLVGLTWAVWIWLKMRALPRWRVMGWIYLIVCILASIAVLLAVIFGTE